MYLYTHAHDIMINRQIPSSGTIVRMKSITMNRKGHQSNCMPTSRRASSKPNGR